MNILHSKTAFYVALCVIVGGSAFWAGRASVQSASASATAKNAAGNSKSGGSSSIAVSQPAQVTSLEDLLNSKGKPNGDLLANWAKNLTPEETAAALKSLQSLPAGVQRNSILSAVVNAWAARDPQGFLSSNNTVSIPRMREGGVDTALRTWASQDPKAALDWLKTNPGSAPPAALQQRYNAAIAGYASTDPQGALTAVAALSEASPSDMALKNNALVALTNAVADSGNFSDALTMFSQLPTGQWQNSAYNTLVQRWAETNPADASVWISSLTDPAQRSQLGNRVAQTWAASDPAAAAAWAAQADQQALAAPGPNGQPASSQLLANVISSWAAYDLDAPAQYLNSLPAGAGKDSAVAIFATRAGQQDASGAIQWVSTISDEQLRSRAATAVAFQMMQSDPASFNTFMANNTLMTDQQKQMLQNIPPGMASRIGLAMAGVGGGGGGGRGGFGGFGGGGGSLDPSSAASPVNGFQSNIDNMILSGGGFFNGGGPGGGGFGGGPGGGGGGFGGGRGNRGGGGGGNGGGGG